MALASQVTCHIEPVTGSLLFLGTEKYFQLAQKSRQIPKVVGHTHWNILRLERPQIDKNPMKKSEYQNIPQLMHYCQSSIFLFPAVAHFLRNQPTEDV